MNKRDFTLFTVIAVLLAYLIIQNEKNKAELRAHQQDFRKLSQLVVHHTTVFKAKENHSYYIKAKLVRESGEKLIIPIFQTTTGISGDDNEEALLHLVEHLSEDNQRYFRLRTQNDNSWSLTRRWRQLVAPEGYDLSPDEWDRILNTLFGRDMWHGSDESTGRWKLSGQESHTTVGIIIEEIEGSHSDASMGVYL